MSEFECIPCKKIFKRKDTYKKHLTTNKHLCNVNETPKMKHICDHCGKEYIHLSSLIKHKNGSCYYKNIILEQENKSDKLEQMFITMINENNELKKSIKELSNKVVHTTTQNIQNNFNLNVFLNEKCKHALNIKDFVNSLKIELEDVYYTQNNGLEKSVSNIFLNGLKELGEYKRPIHCSDAKRQTFYIKDEDSWEKDTNKEKLKKSINFIQDKQIKIITEWENNNPDWKNNENKKDEYIEIVQQVMRTINEDKVVREISKNTTIDTR